MISPQSLTIAAGVLLSLIGNYVPGARHAYDRLSADEKRLVMALLIGIVCMGAYIRACNGFTLGIECSQAGAIGLTNTYILALLANQGTHHLTRPQKAKRRKANGG
jgi:hypothetical protein